MYLFLVGLHNFKRCSQMESLSRRHRWWLLRGVVVLLVLVTLVSTLIGGGEETGSLTSSPTNVLVNTYDGSDEQRTQMPGGNNNPSTSVPRTLIRVEGDYASSCEQRGSSGRSQHNSFWPLTPPRSGPHMAELEARCLLQKAGPTFTGGLVYPTSSNTSVPSLLSPTLFNLRREAPLTPALRQSDEGGRGSPAHIGRTRDASPMRGEGVMDGGGVVVKEWSSSPRSTMWALRNVVRGGLLEVSLQDGTMREAASTEVGGGAQSEYVSHIGPAAVQEDYFRRLDLNVDFPQLGDAARHTSPSNHSGGGDDVPLYEGHYYFANSYDPEVYPNGPGGLRMWYDGPLANYFFQPYSRWRSQPGKERIVMGRGVNSSGSGRATDENPLKVKASANKPQGVPVIPDYVTLDCRGGGGGAVYQKVWSELARFGGGSNELLRAQEGGPSGGGGGGDGDDAGGDAPAALASELQRRYPDVDEGVLSTLLGRTRISVVLRDPHRCLAPSSSYSSVFPPKSLVDWRLWLGVEAPAWRVVKVAGGVDSSGGASSLIMLRRRVKAFHFAVTGGKDSRAVFAEFTWGQRTPLQWYADVSVGALRPLVSPSRHPLYVQDKFNFLTYRMARIWEMTYQNFLCKPKEGPLSPQPQTSCSISTSNIQYDWFIRLWDDNYYNEEGLYNVLGRLQPQAHSLMLGKNTWRNLGIGGGKMEPPPPSVSLNTSSSGDAAAELMRARLEWYAKLTPADRRRGGVYPFSGGGAGWFLSVEGMRTIGGSFSGASSAAGVSGYDWLGEINKRRDLYIKHALHNEDIFLTAWFYILNVTILNMPGVEHVSPGLGPRQRCMREELLWQLRWGRNPMHARMSLLVPSISDVLPLYCKDNRTNGGAVQTSFPPVPRTPRLSPDEATADVKLIEVVATYFGGEKGEQIKEVPRPHESRTRAIPTRAIPAAQFCNTTDLEPKSRAGHRGATSRPPFASPIQLFYEYTSSDPLLLVEDAHYSASAPIVWHYMSPYRLLRMEALLYGGAGDTYFKGLAAPTNGGAQRKWRREHDFEVESAPGSGKYVAMPGIPVTNSDKKVPLAKRRPCYRGTPYKRVMLGGAKEGGALGAAAAITILDTATGKRVHSSSLVNSFLMARPPSRSVNGTAAQRPAPMEEYIFYQPEEGVSIFEYPLADPPIVVEGA